MNKIITQPLTFQIDKDLRDELTYLAKSKASACL